MHKVARSYGKWPSELLDLPADELSLVVLCYLEAEGVASDTAAAITRKRGMVIPIVNIGA